MKITSHWLDGRCFIASNSLGHSVIMDGTSPNDGLKRGASPMECLLMSMACCASIDIIEIAKKQRQQVLDCLASVEGERADNTPRIFTKIHIHFKILGHDLQTDAIAKAVSLSAEKYCSASIMLSKAAEVSHSFEVINVE